MKRLLLTVALWMVVSTAYGATLATYTLGQGWATFGLALPQGAATGAVQAGSLPTQTDVKTTWPDGSIRFAVVTAHVLAAGTYAIAPGTQATGAFSPPRYPTAVVSFTSGGQVYTATPPLVQPVDTWLFGSLVREYRILVTPVTATGQPMPLIQVLFDGRIYRDGGGRVDMTVQNVQDVAAGGPVTYDVLVSVDGVTVYQRAAMTHPYLTRWRKVYFSQLAESAVTPDFEPFYQAKAIPRFLSTVVDPTPTFGPQFDALGYGDMSVDMGAPGGRPEIAPYPNWTAQYLVHKRPLMRNYMLASGNLSGSWRGHLTEPDGLTLINLDTYPHYWLSGQALTGQTPRVGMEAARVFYQGSDWPGGFSWPIETAHHPSLTYVPYLITGDRFYLDQMRFWVNFTLLDTGGNLMNAQTRGAGWSIRDLADLAAYIPDADPMRAYFRTRLQTNLDGLDSYARTFSGGPIEWLFPLPGHYGVTVTSLWANSYVAWALDHAAAHGFGPVSNMRDRIVRTQIWFFSSAPDYPTVCGAPYYPVIGPATGGLFSTMAQVYAATQVAYTTEFGTDWQHYACPPFAGYYGPEARLMFQIGVRDGVAGAAAAMTTLTANPSVLWDVNYRSGWAVQP